MSGNWRHVILRDVCTKVDYGYTASAQDEPVGPKFLRITDIVPDLIDWNGVPYCEIDEEKREKYRLHKGDIVIARTGATTGYAKFIREERDVVFASYLVRVRPSEEHDSRFIGIVVESSLYKQFIQANLSGAAQPNANAQVLTSFPFSLPPLPTQRRIAAVLSAYDDLIEVNQQRIEALEAAAQALYREWFVEMRFPGYESAEWVESELGVIPAGWRIRPLEDVSELITRGYQPKYDDESDCRVINQRCIRDYKIDLTLTRGNDETKRPITQEERFVRFGDVLVNSTGTGTLGRVAQVYENLHKHTVDSHVTIVRPNNSVNIDYFGLLMQELQHIIEQMGRGATNQTELNKSELGELPVLVPPDSLQSTFSYCARPMRELLNSLSRRNTELRETRDLLLPRLISGEVSVEGLPLPGE